MASRRIGTRCCARARGNPLPLERGIAFLLAAALAFALAGCGSDPGARRAGAVARPIPEAELSRLEAPVQQRLREARSQLDTALVQADAAKLAAAYGELGMLYHAYELAPAAEPCYLNAQELNPDDARWPYYLGHLYRSALRREEAVAAFERVLELEPGHVSTLVHLGRLELEANRAENAEKLFQRAIEIDPASAPALVGLGKLASTRRDFSRAVELLERAREIAPQATEVLYPLGVAYRRLGKLDQAQRLIEQRGEVPAPLDDPWYDALISQREGWRRHLNMGTALYRQGLHREALSEFREAVRQAPDQAVAHINLGSALTMVGRVDEAIKEFEQALRLEPSSDLAHFNAGTLLARQGDDARAIEHYEAALRSAPGRQDARFNLANALRRVGRFADAAEQYRRVVDADPRNAAARLAEALSLMRLRRWLEARTQLEAGLAALPGDRGLRAALARVLAAAPAANVRDGERALALARALVLEDGLLEHHVALAMAAAETGDFKTAVASQSGAIEAARGASRPDLADQLESDLKRYREGKPCRTPWPEDDPMLSPGRSPEGRAPARVPA